MYETIRIVEKLKPKYVIWENVKNLLSKKHRHNFDNYLDKMSELGYTNYYQVLNAKDYGIPQNRERVFTISILGGGEFKFPEKQELKLKLKDMLEDNVDEKYFLSDKLIQCFSSDGTGNYPQGGVVKDGEIINHSYTTSEQRDTLDKYIESKDGIMPTLTTRPDVLGVCVKNATKLGYDVATDGDSVNLQQPNSTTRRGRVGHQISNTLQTSDSMGVVVKSKDKRLQKNQDIANSIITTEGNKPTCNFIKQNLKEQLCDKLIRGERFRQNLNRELVNKTKFEEGKVMNLDTYNQTTNENVSQCLTDPKHNNQRLFDGLRIRKLTPKECWRLMGFNDEEFSKAEKVNSNAQLYKQAGNSIVVNVLESIFKNLFKERTNENSNTDVMQKQEEQPTSDMEHENTQTDDYAEQIILTI